MLLFIWITAILAQNCEGDDCEDKVEQDHTYMTYGSTFKLRHMMSGTRLHSLQVTYGMGSGQQAVTAIQDLDDTGSLWIIKCADKKCKSGQPVKEGDVIVMTHLLTKKNIHSHHQLSEITRQQEVSAFGNDGVGDGGDYWIVEPEKSGFWLLNGFIRLKH
ncbi:MIR domain containing protein, partial [Entamoeba invadens IP1]